MKTLTLRISDEEHGRMKARAEQELLPVATLLRRLFQQYEHTSPPPAAKKHTSPTKRADPTEDPEFLAWMNGDE
jgi:hypothetical protein